ncbi:hypothetical protein FCL47_02115 [Desulfopila sp. IMCC35006]|uniref:hypothetical protein n=1 Tax=Desulfopila sp. IMCC35006 TaxID=2569542 RepID=UPI0010AC9475|nr:hypothetical protein [Desulfopila sp. IMCC35006]TKB28312.1 hypothetical protein FCL47_02115 [Desulfopila sp. IMCC35006]
MWKTSSRESGGNLERFCRSRIAPRLAVLFQGTGILSYRPENKIMMCVSNNAESAGSHQGASRFDALTSRLSERGKG